MDRDGDCTIVDRSVRLQDLKHWKVKSRESVPFYMSTERNSGFVFNGSPEMVRNLVRSYNIQKLFFSITLMSFLKAEGISVHRVLVSADDMLGYHVDLTNN
jgi:hypothetical protein